MIFYFTATGSAKFIAERISSETGEPIENITECVQAGRFAFDLGAGGTVGIVSPVYFRGVPMIVEEFLRQLSIPREPGTYSYVVLNSSGTNGAAEKFARSLFQANAVFDVATVSNYVPMYQVGSAEKVKRQLDGTQREVDAIVELIKDRRTGVFKSSAGRVANLSPSLFYPVYKNGKKPSKFAEGEASAGGGTCAGDCPRNASGLDGGRPVWTAPPRERC